MARKIEYDSTKLQQSLTDLFWNKGFAETSLADIEAASGLNRRQLYNGIGDKHAMFLTALDTFAEQAGRQFLAALEGADAGIDDIEALLRLFAFAASSEDMRKGCMVCTVSQEEVSGEDAVASRIDAYFSRIRAAYRNALQRATDRGEIRQSAAAIDLRTDALFGVHVGICVLLRAGRPGDELNRMVDQALNDLRA